jgi:hypothetical protein
VGRIVQCARCSHRWLQTVAAAKAEAARVAVDVAMNSPATAPGAAFSASPPASEPEPQIGAPSKLQDRRQDGPQIGNIIGSTGFSLGPARPTEPVEPVEAIPDLVIRPPRQRTSLPAVIEVHPGMRLPTRILIVVVVLAIVAALAGAGYFYRNAVAQMLPAGWRTMLHLGS